MFRVRETNGGYISRQYTPVSPLEHIGEFKVLIKVCVRVCERERERERESQFLASLSCMKVVRCLVTCESGEWPAQQNGGGHLADSHTHQTRYHIYNIIVITQNSDQYFKMHEWSQNFHLYNIIPTVMYQ